MAFRSNMYVVWIFRSLFLNWSVPLQVLYISYWKQSFKILFSCKCASAGIDISMQVTVGKISRWNITPLFWFSERVLSISISTLCSRTLLPTLLNGLGLIQALPSAKDLHTVSALPFVSQGENLLKSIWTELSRLPCFTKRNSPLILERKWMQV